jgi:FAD/FMN-containing dehydrogenase
MYTVQSLTLDSFTRNSYHPLEDGFRTKAVISLGGCPLAEHGVGRNPTKKALLKHLYEESGLQLMLAVKHALNPEGKLAPSTLFSEPYLRSSVTVQVSI